MGGAEWRFHRGRLALRLRSGFSQYGLWDTATNLRLEAAFRDGRRRQSGQGGGVGLGCVAGLRRGRLFAMMRRTRLARSKALTPSVVASLIRRPHAYWRPGTSCGSGCGSRRAGAGPDPPTALQADASPPAPRAFFPRTTPRHGGRGNADRTGHLERAACRISLTEVEQVAAHLLLAELIGERR